MDYIVECRPSQQLIEALSKADLGESIIALFRNLVFFARNISCEDGPGVNDLEPILKEAFAQTVRDLPPWTHIDFDRLRVLEGSVVILIFVSVAAFPHGVAAGEAAAVTSGIAAGTLACWVADKVLGGALEQSGKMFAEKICREISDWWRRKGGEPPPITTVDPRDIADSEALQVAQQHGCVPAMLTGGTRVGRHRYRYVYELSGCSKKLLTITVDSQDGKVPPETIVL